MQPASRDTEGLDGVGGADHELVQLGVLAKLERDGIAFPDDASELRGLEGNDLRGDIPSGNIPEYIGKIEKFGARVVMSCDPGKLSGPGTGAYRMRTFVILAASAVMLASCSNPKEANKDNFQHAINDWIEKSPPCLSMPDGSVTVANQARGELPVYVEADPAAQSYSEESRQRHLAPLDALVNAGLLKSSRTEVDQGQGMFGSNNKKVAVIAYDFTEKGKSAFKAEEAQKSSFGGTRSGFCYGKPEVDEVTQFTQPGDMMGMTISQMSYKYHLADLPDWAKNPKVKSAFSDLARNTADSLDAKAALVLTNDGWKHEKAI